MLSHLLFGSKKRVFCDYMYWSCEGAPLSRAMVDPFIEINVPQATLVREGDRQEWGRHERHWTVKVNENQPDGSQQRLCLSRAGYNKGVSHWSCGLGPKAARGVGKRYGGKREGLGVPWWEAVSLGNRRWAPWMGDIPCDWLVGVHVWLSLAGPKLEAGANIREAVSS